MDWSSPGEILAIGGHKQLNDLNYTNQILFYTRRGEFLHRIHIPQTVCSFVIEYFLLIIIHMDINVIKINA